MAEKMTVEDYLTEINMTLSHILDELQKARQENKASSELLQRAIVNFGDKARDEGVLSRRKDTLRGNDAPRPRFGQVNHLLSYGQYLPISDIPINLLHFSPSSR